MAEREREVEAEEEEEKEEDVLFAYILGEEGSPRNSLVRCTSAA